MLEQMAEMFQKMGMTVDINQLKAMMKQFQSSSIWNRPGETGKRRCELQLRYVYISKLFQSGMPINDML